MLVSCSDTHLCENVYVSLPRMKGDTHRAFQQIGQYAVDNKATALLLGGDIFDSQPSPLDVECFLSVTSKLKKAGVKVFAIQGQHGRNDELAWPNIDPYVIDLHGKMFEVEEGVFMTGFDNMGPGELQQRLKELDPKCNLLVLHQLMRGTVPESVEGHQCWDLDPQWIPPHVQLVLVGDWHYPWNTKIIHELAEKQPPLGKQRASELIYHGSTVMQSVSEPADKYFLRIHYERGLPLIDQTPVTPHFKWERIPINNRPFREFTVNTDQYMSETVLPELAKLEPETFVHIKYDASVPEVRERVMAANNACHYLFKILPIKTAMDEKMELANIKEIGLDSCLALACDPTKDPELYNFTLALVKSANPKATLAELKNRYLEVKHDPAPATAPAGDPQAGPEAGPEACPFDGGTTIPPGRA